MDINFSNNNHYGNTIYGDYDIYISKSIDNLSVSKDVDPIYVLDTISDLSFILFGNTIDSIFKPTQYTNEDNDDYDENTPIVPKMYIHIENMDHLYSTIAQYYKVLAKTCHIFNTVSDDNVRVNTQDIFVINIATNTPLLSTKSPKNLDKKHDPIYNIFLEECTNILSYLHNDCHINDGLLIYVMYSMYIIDVPMKPILLKNTKNKN